MQMIRISPLAKALALAAAASTLAAGAALAQTAPPPPPAAEAPADLSGLVAARQGGMAMAVYALGAISSGVEKQAPTKSMGLAAMGLSEFAQSLPVLFDPATQAVGGSDAKPDLYSDWAGFSQRAAAFHDAAEAMRAAIAKDDATALATALASTKAACKACHDSYRAEH
jgi:cytochrome c556